MKCPKCGSDVVTEYGEGMIILQYDSTGVTLADYDDFIPHSIKCDRCGHSDERSDGDADEDWGWVDGFA